MHPKIRQPSPNGRGGSCPSNSAEPFPGEHGDGLVRSPFMKRMFGPVAYEAFREIKRTFDPQGL